VTREGASWAATHLTLDLLDCWASFREKLATCFARSGFGKLMAHQCPIITLFPNCDIHASANWRNNIVFLIEYWDHDDTEVVKGKGERLGTAPFDE
jgi:hypothetical protein